VRNPGGLRRFRKASGEVVLQEFIRGQEFTVDVYAGLDGVPRVAVPRQRLQVRAGEVAKGLTMRHEGIISESMRLVSALEDCVGVVTCQCRLTKGGEVKFFDLNPRFGGGVPLAILRLSGIYGPGRNGFVTLQAGRARRLVKPGQVFNRIHVDDLVTTLLASMERPCAGRIYNVSDDEPAPADVVTTHAAELLGLVPPPAEPFAEAELSPFARHFYNENRRVHNGRIKRELGVRLRYPSYREGLAALAAAA
jgi:hypothetical protein